MTTGPATATPTGPTGASPSPAPATGDAILDAAVVELAGLEGRPLEEHLEVGERVLSVLSGRLRHLGGA
ncbi:MAG TPA: hypothetical protein VFJ94_04670 [Intrasporangium sp.]|uniref:hypothetical protein n=1 Tax=Intrasporangium sp. TaxID=1925024 RepID=UPI002D79B323|nr:hypothetical protein [Intrasporangium sp.]HET7397794.1 hypothetical protein [Intrasporangium sp.]